MNPWIIPHVHILGLTFLIACTLTLIPVIGANALPHKQSPGAAHNGNTTTSKNTSQCEPLLLPACKALNMYNSVLLPNSLGHSSQHEVSRAFKKFAPMLKTPGCGDWLSVLLCLTYAPPCPADKLPSSAFKPHLRVVTAPACRQLCASAWAGCWSSMEKAGLHWPHALDCERMPIGAEEDGQECVTRRGKVVHHTDIPTELTTPTKRTPTVKTPALAKEKTTVSPKSNYTKKPAAPKTPKAPSKTVPSNVKTSKPTKKNQSPETKPKTEVKPETHSSTGKPAQANNAIKQMKSVQKIKPRRYDINEVGEASLFRGWADVQGQGAANDYCRVIGRAPKHRFLACALAGRNGQEHRYVSRRGFDVGHSGTWFMRDMDKDGRDDYCRCVGSGLSSRIACMKAGKHGFYGSLTQPGNQYTFYVKARSSCYGKTTNPLLGLSSKF